MQGRKNIWYKKLAAAFLLLLLSTVTIIQLSHSHNAAGIAQKVIIQKSDVPGYDIANLESKCFICEYQLAKDVDVDAAVFPVYSATALQSYLAATYNFTITARDSFIETRGPPSLA